MDTPLSSRERAVEVIRTNTQDDLWLERYALLLAVEMLDIVQVNQLADSVATAAGPVRSEDRQKLRALVVERFGR